MGEDDAVREHLAGCKSCAAEERALKETLGHLDRYSQATLPGRRRAGSMVIFGSFAAAALLLIALFVFVLGPSATIEGEGTYLVSNGGGWRFAIGETSLSHDLRVGTLPDEPVHLGEKIRIEGGSLALISSAGNVHLQEGVATIRETKIKAGGWQVDVGQGQARVDVTRGVVVVELKEGNLVATRGGETRRARGPATLTLSPSPEEMQIVVPRVPQITLQVDAGTPVAPEFERYLSGEDEKLKLLVLRMAVVLELNALLPAIRRAAVEDKSKLVRTASLYAIWRLDPDRAFLRKRAEVEKSIRVRRSAYFYLGSSATKKDIAFLLAATRDRDVDSEAIFALAHMAMRGIDLSGKPDDRIRELFTNEKFRGRRRYACVRYLQERDLITVKEARMLFFDVNEDSGVRRMASVELLAADRKGAVVAFRKLFEFDHEGSRIIAIDLLCHYGTIADARRVAALLNTGTPAEQKRVFYALGLRANLKLNPPVPLRPTAEQRERVKERLLEWVGK